MDIVSQSGQNNSIPVDMLCSAMHIPRATYYRHLESNKYAQEAQTPSHTPVNALNDQEKQCVLDLLRSSPKSAVNSRQFIPLSPCFN